MKTFQGMRMNVDFMMEQMRINAIMDTFEKFKVAARNYYTQGYDNGETVKLIKDLERLGANMDIVFNTDFEIREEVANTKKS